jgi:hypothetical protein
MQEYVGFEQFSHLIVEGRVYFTEKKMYIYISVFTERKVVVFFLLLQLPK